MIIFLVIIQSTLYYSDKLPTSKAACMESKLKNCTVSRHLTPSVGPATLSEATPDETDFTIAD